jgi:hypothetical protein
MRSLCLVLGVVFLTASFGLGEEPAPAPSTPAPATPPPKATPAPPTGVLKGIPVPGKPGFVSSPYAPTAGFIDVRGFPSGTEVKDPYSGKTFLVP